jgi:hypothetical protein
MMRNVCVGRMNYWIVCFKSRQLPSYSTETGEGYVSSQIWGDHQTFPFVDMHEIMSYSHPFFDMVILFLLTVCQMKVGLVLIVPLQLASF